MKFSYNWLRELVEGLDAPPQELALLITLKTAECEGVEEAHSDHIIEVDNKSLTHRPDLWGHYGMAREVAAILGKKLRDPVKPGGLPDVPAPIRVTIENYPLCPRYSALVFENVQVRPSPPWLQRRLEAIGLNPISNVVDVTNFVMAEIAQPMHAFDAGKLHGEEIIVRLARSQATGAGEKFAALNEQSYELDASNLVIADAQEAIALAGVIGGAGSAISAATTRLVLESANFNASSIRKTSARLKLRTDASMRFEKAQDPVNTVRGLRRALELLEQVSPGIRLVGGLADAYRPLPKPEPIVLRLDWLEAKLGRRIPAADVRKILESLDFEIQETASRTFHVTPPSWRATKDITIKDDLVEEIGRMIGYDSITPVAPLSPARVPPANPEREFHHRLREMAAAQGFTEVYNYSFISEDMARVFDLEPGAQVEVANPIASDQNLLRTSLRPGIWKNILSNARHFDAFRLFEIGREIHRDAEIPHFCAAIYSKDDGVAGLLELKRLAECLLPGVIARPTAAVQSYEHPQRSAEMCFLHVQGGAAVVGRLFEFHPRMVEAGRAAVLDLDLIFLEKVQPPSVRYRPWRTQTITGQAYIVPPGQDIASLYPTSAFDLSVIASPRVLIDDIRTRLSELARKALTGNALASVNFLREFLLPDGSRSLSYRLTVGALDRTLSSDEVTAIRAGMIEGMRAAGFELRV